MKINAYLTFGGNCREAMTFYQQCLGGHLMLQPVKETPLASKMPKEMKDSILHASLSTEEFVIMGSDMTPAIGIIKGNTTSMVINCESEVSIREAFEKLSGDGIVHHSIEATFWGALLGDLTDKFGNNWILNFKKPLSNTKKNEKG